MGVPGIEQFDWTETATNMLRALFHDGLSASQMGGELGVSRSAVLGKLRRLGLQRGRAIARPDAKAPRKPRGPYKRVPWAVPAVAEAPRQANTEPARAFVPEPRFACTILDLTNETCRYPITDDLPHMFCGTPGADLAGGMPYCQAHMGMAYRA